MIAVFLYNLSITFYAIAVHVAAFLKPKAKAFIVGRKNQQSKIADFAAQNTKTTYWFHCASLGEFEQARPVLEALKSFSPEIAIVLSFFSPSGYEVRKNYPLADLIIYLPLDRKKAMQTLLATLKPEVLIIVKYEFWYHFIHEAKKMDCQVLSISAIFRPSQQFFKATGGLQRKILRQFDHLFVQNKESLALLQGIGIQRASIAGDTRFDRVLTIKDQRKKLPFMELFCGSQPLLVAGSTWPQDHDLLLPMINGDNNGLKYVIAPHEIHAEEIQALKKRINKKVILHSESDNADLANADVLIIDNIGMLSSLYAYGKYAYVGGAFGKGLHNTLEPAAFNIPVFFGDKQYKKFQEAVAMKEQRLAFPVAATMDLRAQLNRLENTPKAYASIAKQSKQFMNTKAGATNMIMNYLKNNSL